MTDDFPCCTTGEHDTPAPHPNARAEALDSRIARGDLHDEADHLADYADTADIGGDPLVSDMAAMIRALLAERPAPAPDDRYREGDDFYGTERSNEDFR